MSPEQIKARFPNASAAFIKRNLHLCGSVPAPEREPAKVQALVERPKVRRGGKGRVVAVVTIIAFKRRFSDDDNLSSGAKTLRDCIAASLGVDDGDKRIKWEYGFVQSAGPEQTLVKISLR